MTIQIFNPYDVINEKYTGRLMEINESFETGYNCTIWYNYTRELYNKLKEGSFIVVKNFKLPKDPKNEYYSILKIIKKMPTHYASVERLAKSYPAFSEESIKGVRDSFTDQITESFEDLTKIVVNAVPTFFQVCLGEDSDSIEKIKIEVDESIPILGEETKILHRDVIEKIVNGSFTIDDDNIIELASLKDYEEIKLFLDIENCLKTHFGIFGFTGVGKTNLLSTFISKIFTKINPKKKILFFDIMDEYFGLLIDLFFQQGINAYYIYLSYYDLSNDLKTFFKTGKIPNGMIDRFYKQLVLPKELKIPELKRNYCECIEKIFTEKKIRFFQKRTRIIDWLNEVFSEFLPKISIDKTIFRNSIINYFQKLLYKKFNLYTEPMNGEMKLILCENLNKRILKGDLTKEEAKKTVIKLQKSLSKKVAISPQQTTLTGLNTSSPKIKNPSPKKEIYFHSNFSRSTWKTQLSNFLNTLNNKEVLEVSEYENYLFDEKDIIEEVHSKDSNSLFIFISSKEANVRDFLNQIGNHLYDKRRNEGLIDPITSLIFDEADTFIPQGVTEESVVNSKLMIEQIARRGRKFGLGVGLATQRITFLETNILAQLHTYFISRLPRKSDRDRIKEAFSLTDEEFEATLKFVKGNWLLVSHEGLGLEGIPLSIKAKNANNRIRKFLKEKINND
ncbi:MAG: ATP-binding protein [Candidatus Thorarchaeota archaeon]